MDILSESCSLENCIKWEIYCSKALSNAAWNHLKLRHFALILQVWKTLLYFKFQHSNFGCLCILALRLAVESLDKIEGIKFLTFFCLLFLLEILLNKMLKSSFFYQAEILHSCGKLKKSTGSQSSSIVAPRMANILTSEKFVKSVGGTLSCSELDTFWLLVGIVQGLTAVTQRGGVTKIVQMSNSLSFENRVIGHFLLE